jgi:hypothetical protein
MFGHYAQLFAVAGVAPGVGHARRTDHPLSRLVVSFLPSDADSQGARKDLVLLFLVRVDMLGHRKARRQDGLDAQQIAVRLSGGLEEGYLRPERRVLFTSPGWAIALSTSCSLAFSGQKLVDERCEPLWPLLHQQVSGVRQEFESHRAGYVPAELLPHSGPMWGSSFAHTSSVG